MLQLKMGPSLFIDVCCSRDFAAQVDILTVEIEHVDVPALQAAAQQLTMDVEPTPATLQMIQVLRPVHQG